MPSLKTIFFGLRSLGVKKAMDATQYARMRDHWNQRVAQPSPPPPAIAPGALREAAPIESGARFRFDYAALEVVFMTADMARLTWQPGLLPVSYALAKQDWPPCQTTLSPRDDGYTLSGAAVNIVVSAQGAITFLDLAGKTLRAELPPERRGESWSQQTRLEPEAALYGLGERAAPLNLRGRSYRMWNTDPGGSYGPGKDPIYICLPLYLARHAQGSYLVFYENSFDGTIALGKTADRRPPADDVNGMRNTEYATASFTSGALRYYFIAGPISAALARYTELTGRASLPPRWALGYHQSRWGYHTADEIRSVIAGFKEHELPLSAIHLDIDYMDGYRLFTVDNDRFPRLEELTRELEADGVKTVAILDCGVKKDKNYPVYTSGLQENAFCTLPDGKPLTGLVWPGESVYPDFTHPAARRWWGEQYPKLLDLGVAGIWHDMNEPTSFSAWGDPTLPLPTQHFFDGRGGDHREGHNLYGFLMARAGWEALRKHRPERRPWLITRSAWAGFQRYTWNWTGDTETSWASLKQTIPTVINLGLSGQPFSGPDVGGFSGSPDAEMYTRWFQMAAFLPFFRTHAAWDTPRREPWAFGEPYTSIMREFLRLRYRLMPYFYTLAWQAAQSGLPMVRPVCWPDWSDESLWEVHDEFLLGDDLLVAPIVEANSRGRRVALPPGKWQPFWGGEPLSGPATVEVSTKLERIPLFVRAGAILPFDENGSLTLRAVPGEDGAAQCVLYSDSGDGYSAWRVDRFRVDGNGRLTQNSEGEFPFPYSATRLEFFTA